MLASSRFLPVLLSSRQMGGIAVLYTLASPPMPVSSAADEARPSMKELALDGSSVEAASDETPSEWDDESGAFADGMHMGQQASLADISSAFERCLCWSGTPWNVRAAVCQVISCISCPWYRHAQNLLKLVAFDRHSSYNFCL